MDREYYLKEIVSTADPDISPEALAFYFSHFPRYMSAPAEVRVGFRGDTMLSLGWTFGSGNKTGPFNRRLRSYLPLFSEADVALFMRFRSGYHCRANLVVIPEQLNIWRGMRKKGTNDEWGRGQGDYFDLFISQIRAYYLSLPLPPDGKEEEGVERRLSRERDWLDSFGEGERGWRAFIDYYCLQPLIDPQSGAVKDLFAPPEAYAGNACPPVGTFHDWDSALPLCGTDDMAVGKERALSYAENSLWVWSQRAELLCRRAAALEEAERP